MTNAFSTRPQVLGSQRVRPTGLRTLASLACGGFAGIVLGTIISIINPFQSKELPIALPELLIITILVGIAYAVFIIGLSVPIWWALSKIGRTTLFDAIALGFLATVVIFMLPSIIQPTGPESSVLRGIEISAMFGLAGAIAGAVTWAVGRSGASA
jgi:hypothetical protein